MLAAAVLAAGRSRRMGRPKALLPCAPGAQSTFVERIVAALQTAGVQALVVIGRPEDMELARVVETIPGARFIGNPDHARGQLTSILTALTALTALDALDTADLQGLLVMPVDMPFVTEETFRLTLQAAAANPDRIIRACHDGRHGHPVVFPRGSFAALRGADASVGAKSVLRARPDLVLDLETRDAGVLRDLDTIEDYAAAFGAVPGRAEI